MAVGADERIENRQDTSAVFEDAIEELALLGQHVTVAAPFFNDFHWNADIPAQLLGRMTAQEEPVKERRFALGEGEVAFVVEMGCSRRHRK